MKFLRPPSRRLRWKLLAVAAVAALTTLAPPASATSPQTATGGFLLTSTLQTSSRQAGRNTIVTETNTGLFFGSQVPALVVVADSGEVLDIYPHRTSGREVTIREVLMPAVS